MAGPCEETARRRSASVREFAARTNTIAAARHFAMETVDVLGFDPEFGSRIALVVSELASNAVEASDDSYSVLIEPTDDGDVVVVVTNRSDDPSLPDREQWGPDEPLATRGRGLGIVEHLAAGVAVEVDPPSVTITAVLSPDGSG